MSTTPTNGTSNADQAPAPNLRTTRKEAAAAKKAAAKPAPAKKAPAKTAAEPKESGKVYVYEATSRAGITNRRSCDGPRAVAADVKDPSHTSKRWQAGVITRLFSSEEQAAKYVERQRESGCDVILVPVTLVETKAS